MTKLITATNNALNSIQITLKEDELDEETEEIFKFVLVEELLMIVEDGYKNRGMISPLGYNECPAELKEGELQVQTELIFQNKRDLKKFKELLES